MRQMLILLLALLLLCPCAAGAAEEPRYIALTFDGGPSEESARLLDALQARGVRATFFLCGSRLEQYPALAERITAEGHEIGLQGYSQRDLSHMSRREIAGEIADTRALLPEHCPVRLLRPQGGSSDAVRQVARVTGLSLAGWSAEPRDWAAQDATAAGRPLAEIARDGDVLALHDLSATSVNTALSIIDRLLQEGFTFVTISELARLREVRLRPGEVYRSFP